MTQFEFDEDGFDLKVEGRLWEEMEDAGEHLQVLRRMVRAIGLAARSLLDHLEGRTGADDYLVISDACSLVELVRYYETKLMKDIGLTALPQLVADDLAAAPLHDGTGDGSMSSV